MVEFFKYATFWSFKEEYHHALIQRFLVAALFDSIKNADVEYDAELRRYYLQRQQTDKSAKEAMAAAEKRGEYAGQYVNPVQIQRPQSYEGQKLEIGGTGAVFDGLFRSIDSDMRHLLAFLNDLSVTMQCKEYVIESVWDNQLGLLLNKYQPDYPIQVCKITFNLYKHQVVRNIIDTHLSTAELHKVRQEGGPSEKYCDEVVPMHVKRFAALRKSGHIEVVGLE